MLKIIYLNIPQQNFRIVSEKPPNKIAFSFIESKLKVLQEYN